MCSALQEFIAGEVLSEHVRRVRVSLYKVETDFLALYHFSYVVVADIYMLGAFFLNCIRGNEDCPLVISTEWNGCDIILQLLKNGVDPYQLSTSV
jgi:hypothetical protein